MELDLHSKLEIFCSGCDHQQPSGVCKLGSADQIRYVLREECGWAMVNGKHGIMTLEGLMPYNQPSIPEIE